MRKPFLLLLAVVLVTANLLAQHHDNATEKVVRTQLTLSSDVQVGSTILRAGDYRIVCNREIITFIRAFDGKKVLEAPCKGQELKAPSKSTEAHLTVEPSGLRVLTKLLLEGSNVEHVF